MVTPIDTKQGIGLSWFDERNKVRSTLPYGESGRVGPTRRTGELDGAFGPTRRMDGAFGPTRLFVELVDAFGPTRRTGELDVAFGPTRPFGELDGVLCPTLQMGELDGVPDPTRPFGDLDCLFGFVVLFYRAFCSRTFANSILPATPRDLLAKGDLLRNGPFFWDSFTLDRIRNAVALYRSRGIFRPLRASDMDEPHPDAVPDQRERVRPRKDKGIALEDKNFVSKDLPLPGWNPGFTPGDGSGTSEAPLPNDFFANLPSGLLLQRHWMKRRGEKWSRKVLEKKGRRAIAAELARRATLFDAEFRSFKDAQDYAGDFRECRGSVGTLWKSQNADFSFLSQVTEMSGLMDGCAQAESMVPPIERRIRELWEPIEVSEDTTEAGADAADKGGEVDQPADSFGASIFGYLDLDL
ncbi:hypothetical protein DY000_02047877 [Brassica cretica]|uniref:AP2/ERF domain-containing protein n=1 Tax=Brassica cretica TaxID=69181 RepID=A0ABQ7ESU3_BRACR|nr:hypothetical protein DY000_02047877 [Brassica cretica]